jgi:hypothetical protein
LLPSVAIPPMNQKGLYHIIRVNIFILIILIVIVIIIFHMPKFVSVPLHDAGMTRRPISHISWPPGLGQDGPQGFVLLNAETGSSFEAWKTQCLDIQGTLWYFNVAMEHHHFNLRQTSLYHGTD